MSCWRRIWIEKTIINLRFVNTLFITIIPKQRVLNNCKTFSYKVVERQERINIFRPVARSPHSELAGARDVRLLEQRCRRLLRHRASARVVAVALELNLEARVQSFRKIGACLHVSVASCVARPYTDLKFSALFQKQELIFYLVSFLAILNDAAINVRMIGELFVDQDQQRFKPGGIQKGVAVFFRDFNDETPAVDVFFGFPLRLDPAKIRDKKDISNHNKIFKTSLKNKLTF